MEATLFKFNKIEERNILKIYQMLCLYQSAINFHTVGLYSKLFSLLKMTIVLVQWVLYFFC